MNDGSGSPEKKTMKLRLQQWNDNHRSRGGIGCSQKWLSTNGGKSDKLEENGREPARSWYNIFALHWHQQMRDKYQSLTINCGFQRRSCQKMLWHWGLQPPWMYNKRRLLWVQIQMNSSPSQVALPWELKRRRWWHEELESHSIMWVIKSWSALQRSANLQRHSSQERVPPFTVFAPAREGGHLDKYSCWQIFQTMVWRHFDKYSKL